MARDFETKIRLARLIADGASTDEALPYVDEVWSIRARRNAWLAEGVKGIDDAHGDCCRDHRPRSCCGRGGGVSLVPAIGGAHCAVQRNHRFHELALRRQPQPTLSLPRGAECGVRTTGIHLAGRSSSRRRLAVLVEGWPCRSRWSWTRHGERAAGLAKARSDYVGRQHGNREFPSDTALRLEPEPRKRVRGRVLPSLTLRLPALGLPGGRPQHDCPLRPRPSLSLSARRSDDIPARWASRTLFRCRC